MGSKYKFYHPLRVRYVETDAQGHVFFGNYLTYFDVSLTEYTRSIGYHYPDMVASGVDMYYVEATCQYKGRAIFDDLLHVHTRIGHVGNTSFTRFPPDAPQLAGGRKAGLCPGTGCDRVGACAP